MNDLIGDKIDNYRIEALLGEGNFAAVYRAFDLESNKTVALKCIHPHFAVDFDFQMNFLRTVQLVSQLNHPGIVKAISYGQRPDMLYLVLEYIPGGSLALYLGQLTAQNQLIEPRESLLLMAQVADGLAHAHDRGIVHGNIKPENILIQRLAKAAKPDNLTLRAVISDFERARLSSADAQTFTGDDNGMLAYMSPEQCLEQKLDGRADIYSLGVILFQLVTGQLPFNIQTSMEALNIHPYEPPPLPSSIRPSLPKGVDILIQKTLAKKPEERVQKAAKLALGLRKVAGTLGADQNAVRNTVSLLNQMAAAGTDLAGAAPQVAVPEQPAAEALKPSVGLLSPQEPTMSPPASDFMPQEVPPGAGQILITNQAGSSMTVHMDKPQLSIGRMGDNDVILSAPDVSRHHARLDFMTNGWQVTDLASSGGTKLAGKRLPINQPQWWPQNQPLEMGPYTLRWHDAQALVAAAQPAGSGFVSHQGQALPASPGLTAAAGNGRFENQPPGQTINPSIGLAGSAQLYSLSGQFRLLIPNPNQTVTPGEASEFQVQVQNEEQILNHVQLRVEQLPAEWVTMQRDSAQLGPGEQEVLTFTVDPPKQSDVAAGPHPYKLVVTSVQNPNETAELAGQITVAPFEQFTIEVQPTQIQGQGIAQVSIHNQGNSEAGFAIVGQAPVGGVKFDGERGRLNIPSGQSKTWPVEVKADPQPLIGGNERRPYSIRVGTKDGETQSFAGELIVPPLLPTWALMLGAFLITFTLITLLLFAAVTIFGDGFGLVAADGTTSAEAVAAGVEGTRRAENDLATQAAADLIGLTATAVAQEAAIVGDSDGDGLSDVNEAAFRSDPNNPDTDGDGLSDGREVNEFRTSPTQRDSDSDGLEDGEEVNVSQTDPMNLDTDGDGIPDGAEIQAGSDPRATPSPIPSATLLPSPTATANAPPSPSPFPSPLPTASPIPPPSPTLAPTNRAPLAVADVGTTNEDQPVTINVLGNDSDPDGDTLTVVTGTAPQNGTAVSNGNGTMTYTPNNNYNGPDSFTYTISDGSALSTTSVNIQVDPINDLPTDITLNPSNINENQPPGTQVGILSATDIDNTTHIFSLVNGSGDIDNSAFTINGVALRSNTNFDFETKSSYSIRVRADDGQGGTFARQLNITISDGNEAPTDISLTSEDVDEEQPAGTAVGMFNVVDPNPGDSHTYKFVSGSGDADNGSFTIDPSTDELETGAAFDFETKNSYDIRVEVNDGQGGSFQKQFTITVNDVNDAPTDISLTSEDVDENQPVGTVVGTFSVADQDSGDTHTFDLVSGPGSADNGSFMINPSTDKLETDAVFDFETKNSYNIRVEVDDGQGGTFQKQFTITVNDVNEAPTDISLTSEDVDEEQPAGTVVGTFSALDQDSGDTHTFDFVSGPGNDDNGSFTIDPATNELKTAAVFDFETKTNYSIRVGVDDGQGGTFQKQFTIKVKDVPGV